MATSHEMIKVQGVWECLSCERRLIFTSDALPMVLDEGNPTVNHFGTLGDAPYLNLSRGAT